MDYENLEIFVLNKLRNELDKRILYHTVDHTIDVIKTSVEIAIHENLSEYEIILLKSAALLHDIGFIEKYIKNEVYGARIAGEILPLFNYKDEEIRIIQRMIINTDLSEHSPYKIDQILRDADLDYLGRPDYYYNSMLLFAEWNNFCHFIDLKEWYQLQYVFLSRHSFYTDFSNERRNQHKQKIIADIKRLLSL